MDKITAQKEAAMKVRAAKRKEGKPVVMLEYVMVLQHWSSGFA